MEILRKNEPVVEVTDQEKINLILKAMFPGQTCIWKDHTTTPRAFYQFYENGDLGVIKDIEHVRQGW